MTVISRESGSIVEFSLGNCAYIPEGDTFIRVFTDKSRAEFFYSLPSGGLNDLADGNNIIYTFKVSLKGIRYNPKIIPKSELPKFKPIRAYQLDRQYH